MVVLLIYIYQCDTHTCANEYVWTGNSADFNIQITSGGRIDHKDFRSHPHQKKLKNLENTLEQAGWPMSPDPTSMNKACMHACTYMGSQALRAQDDQYVFIALLTFLCISQKSWFYEEENLQYSNCTVQYRTETFTTIALAIHDDKPDQKLRSGWWWRSS